jgi:hypothetical protein
LYFPRNERHYITHCTKTIFKSYHWKFGKNA